MTKRLTGSGLLAVALLTVAGCAGCTASTPAAPTTSATVTSTATKTRDTGIDYRPPKPSYAPTMPSAGTAPKGEKAGRCPYLRSGLEQDPTRKPNAADIGGSRVGFTTVLTTLRPVGCRFYYAYGSQAVVDIVPTTFGSAAAARNAMIRTGEAGRSTRGVPAFVRGVDGVSYRTRFERGDGDRDWAFVFAKGRVMVVVHTREATTSFNAVNVAKAIVATF